MVKTYLETILKNNHSIVIACSGGPDSMALLFSLCELKEKYHNEIIVCHVNHQKREESKEEAEFVKDYALKHNCLFEYYILPHKDNVNFHSYAHQERYNFYERTINKYHSTVLMTAHHATDLAETILMRLVRGATLKGYSGFQKEVKLTNYTLIRPFINLTKEEIFNFVKEQNIPYRSDYTNEEDHYTRNRIRHHILPLLEKENKNFYQHINNFSEKIYETNAFIAKTVENKYDQLITNNIIDISKLQEEDIFLQKKIISEYLRRNYLNEEELTDQIITNILSILGNKIPNQKLNLPANKILIKEYNKLYFGNVANKEYKIELQDNLEINNYIFAYLSTSLDYTNYCIGLSSKEVSLPLYVRSRKPGDKMLVKNLKGHKKIKDILIDEKIPLSKRDTIPLLVDANDNIIWLPGIKKSQLCKDNYEKCDIIIRVHLRKERDYE